MLTATQFLAANLELVHKRIAEAAKSAGRDPSSVRLVAVGKQQPVELIAAAADAGQREFGENYVQEGVAKVEALRGRELVWHFIGQLQANKTRAVAENFQWVHALDRARIAERLSVQRPHYAGPLEVLLQVRLEDEPGKGGVVPGEVADLAETVAGLPRLRLRGLMCIPHPTTDESAQRTPFRHLRALLDELNSRGHALDQLSMGMSADLEAAVREGATMVRIGTAVFGPRS